MKERINNDVICVLRNNQNNEIVVDYIDILNPLSIPLAKFETICTNDNTTIESIVSIIKSGIFDALEGDYRYCDSLRGSYQAFSVKKNEIIERIQANYSLMLQQKRISPDYDLVGSIAAYKYQIYEKYKKYVHAFSIGLAYRSCAADKNILTFSHRISGWSNPVYQLTSNFSVEIKTNFGYGRASYFFTKLKYKNIDITPFSEWIYYEFALFSEIIRYTQTHILDNQYWEEAMNFCKEACNLSKSNEVEFVEKYIINECELMVIGLEEIFHKDHFSFKDRYKVEYIKDKKGHVLSEFRGEKISGALDFISKILEFEGIITMKPFISRIETCNEKIHPILIEEIKIIETKLVGLREGMAVLEPKYRDLYKQNNDYQIRRSEIQRELTGNYKMTIDFFVVDRVFAERFPDFKEFEKEFEAVSEGYRLLTEKIKDLDKTLNNMITYKTKIEDYFRRRPSTIASFV